MSTTCAVTGRIHRTPAEKADELAHLDAQLAAVDGAIAALDALALEFAAPSIIAAWDRLHDAVTALQVDRSEVELNPRPIADGEGDTCALAIDAVD